MIPVNNSSCFQHCNKIETKRFNIISNSTASLNNVDDGQADEPANILEDTDSDKELEKEWQE